MNVQIIARRCETNRSTHGIVLCGRIGVCWSSNIIVVDEPKVIAGVTSRPAIVDAYTASTCFKVFSEQLNVLCEICCMSKNNKQDHEKNPQNCIVVYHLY